MRGREIAAAAAHTSTIAAAAIAAPKAWRRCEVEGGERGGFPQGVSVIIALVVDCEFSCIWRQKVDVEDLRARHDM